MLLVFLLSSLKLCNFQIWILSWLIKDTKVVQIFVIKTNFSLVVVSIKLTMVRLIYPLSLMRVLIHFVRLKWLLTIVSLYVLKRGLILVRFLVVVIRLLEFRLKWSLLKILFNLHLQRIVNRVVFSSFILRCSIENLKGIVNNCLRSLRH